MLFNEKGVLVSQIPVDPPRTISIDRDREQALPLPAPSYEEHVLDRRYTDCEDDGDELLREIGTRRSGHI